MKNSKKILNGIIEDNIEWFWHNDPMLDYETNMTKLWNGFKVWCVENCLELFDNLDKAYVEKIVDNNYSKWTEGKWF